MLKKSRESVGLHLERAGVLPAARVNSLKKPTRSLKGKVRWNSPYGFKYERGRAVRHPQEYETLMIIMSLKEQGLNSREIAVRLNENKLRPRKAKLWDRCTVHRIIGWHEKHLNLLKEIL